MSPVVMVDAEAAVRAWLLTQPQVTAVVGQRIYLGVPPETSRGDNYPLVGVHRLYSTVNAYLPVDSADLQLDCWGRLKNRSSALTAASAIATALWGMTPNTPLTVDVTAKGVSDITTIFQPDPISDRPRFVVTATVLVTAAP